MYTHIFYKTFSFGYCQMSLFWLLFGKWGITKHMCSVNIYLVEKCSVTKKVSETLIEDLIIQILLKPLHFVRWLSLTYQLPVGWNRGKFLHLARLMDKSELIVTVDVTLLSWSCILRMFCGASICPDPLNCFCEPWKLQILRHQAIRSAWYVMLKSGYLCDSLQLFAVGMKIAVCWFMRLCGFVEWYKYFKATWCVYLRGSRLSQQVPLITFCVWPKDGQMWEVAYILVNQRQWYSY